ncbi:MAG TPA: MmcQ/YjbR family DNA-binding protein, partial [Polyangiaceae bacterium]|nr:MmcQ/YjbR family DNA-binding protein [Polyangiaceae bacterium]
MPKTAERGARPAQPASPADAALERVRTICLGFPGAEEKLSHGAPSFHVKGKMFVTFVDDHHGDGLLAVWCKAERAEQQRLVASAPERFFVPPYVGVRGWVGVRLDHPQTDWIGLALIVEEGWISIAPKRLASDSSAMPPAPRPPPPRRITTDAAVSRAALERLAALCLALPEATQEGASRHATFRVRKKVFVYFLDNHHGDGIVGACVKLPKGKNVALAKADPRRFFIPAYIGARGWLGIRLDRSRTDWKDVAARVTQSYRDVAPKTLHAGL